MQTLIDKFYLAIEKDSTVLERKGFLLFGEQ